MYRIDESVLEDIRRALTAPETGGILGIDNTNTVVKFHHDKTGRTIAHRYIPDVQTLNRVIAQWHRAGIKFIGFVHSHRAGLTKLSACDIRYDEKIKRHCGMPEVLMLLYIPDGKNFYQYTI